MKTRHPLTRRFPWHAAVATALLGLLGWSITSYADTYNFYFDKKKPGQAEEQEPAAAPAAPVTTVPQQQVTVPAPTQAPIVINNTNNVGAPAAPAAVPSVAPPPVSVGSSLETRVADLEGTVARPSRAGWKMGLSGMAFLQEMDHGYTSDGELRTYRDLGDTWGGLLSLGYNFSPSFGFNLYGGARIAPDTEKIFYHAGADLEVTPFRLPFFNRKWDLFELGLIFGGSTALAARGNIGTLHAGARVNLNVGPDFAITAAGRGNFGYLLIEGGIVARL